GGDVHERLERAPCGAPGLRAAIELRLAVVAPADQREHLPGLRSQREQTALDARAVLDTQPAKLLLERIEPVVERDSRPLLKAQVERRVDAQTLAGEGLSDVDLGQLAANCVEEIARLARLRSARREREGLRAGGVVVRLVEASLREHELQHQIAPHARA